MADQLLDNNNGDMTKSIEIDLGGGGGGGVVNAPIFGCTDPNATNYNPNATYNDGSCLYAPIESYISRPEVSVNVLIQSSPQNGSVVVDGVLQPTKNTPTGLSFSGVELLTPKIVTLEKSGAISGDAYKIYTIQKERQIFEEIQLPFDETLNYRFVEDPTGVNGVIRLPIETPRIKQNVSYIPYFELIVEKLVDGNYIQQSTLEVTNTLDNQTIDISLNFDLAEAVIIQPIIPNSLNIKINGDVYEDGLITYRTSGGITGNVTNGLNEFTYTPDTNGSNYIEFIPNGLSNATHLVTYIVKSKGNSITYRTLDLKLETSVDDLIIEVTVSKNNIQPAPDLPVLNVSVKSFEFNIAGTDELKIPYNSFNSTEVILSINNVERSLSPDGSIVLTKNDFYNGVGNYILYLQPRSDRGGSGETVRVNINVISKTFLPGPDITHINYPQVISGADFKGYNVDFDISWQSVNTNYVEMYVSKYDIQYAIGKLSASGLVTLNVADVLKKSKNQVNEDIDKVQFEIILVPFNIEGDEVTEGKIERISILFDKGDLKLNRGTVIADIRSAIEANLDDSILEEEISRFLTHYIHLGRGDNKLIATWGIDKETFSEFTTDASTGARTKVKEEKSLVLKLYEPLPREIQPNQQLWISKIQSVPIIEQVTIIDELESKCTPLRPNFNVKITDDIGYQLLDDLIASGSQTSTDLVNSFVNSNNFSLENLNIQYESGSDYYWSNFVKYSSAGERVNNFMYKVELIEFHETQVQLVSESNAFISGSVSAEKEYQKYIDKINGVKNGFDGFEKYLYTTSGSYGITYPGAGYNEVSKSYSDAVINWYAGILQSAEDYDYNNKNLLVNNIPSHITSDTGNDEFVLFLNMIGQHFDTLWAHTRGISQSKKLEHKYEDGIGNELIYHMLESLGWNADMGVQSQFLWEYAFGKSSDGTVISSMSGKTRQHQIWRRILNNLPYLLKHKGTKRALHAAMACYGVPSSLLTVMEFGGPQDPSTDATTLFTFDDRTAALNFTTDSSLEIPFTEYVSEFSTDHPNAIEFRINTNFKQEQLLVRTDGWDLELIPGTGSLAKLEFNINVNDELIIVSTDYIPFFNDEYTNIVINRRTSPTTEVYELYFKEGVGDRIRNSTFGISPAFPLGSTSWESGSILYVGEGFTGSLDEFRLWRTPLSESRIDNHTLLPDAIDGSHISASSVDLLFRLDFEYPKDLSLTGSIKNVAILQDYTGSANALNFTNTDYPFNYVTYERSVTAKVPSSGLTVGNKFRFESQELIGDLNYKSRATKKSFDTAPIDTDRLGLFFSPMKEINMDILRSLGEFNIDDYIGNPADEYRDSYSSLDQLRNYYFQRYNLNIHEYIQLVRYIDKSLFETLESLVPARAKVSSGLLIEPHILERSKVAWKKPSAENEKYEAEIFITDTTNTTAMYENVTALISMESEANLSVTTPNYVAEIKTFDDTNITAINPNYAGTILTDDKTDITATLDNILTTIDAQVTGSLKGQFNSSELIQIGLDKDSLSVAGFGLYGENGNVVRTYRDVWGNYVRERSKVYLVKERYTVNIPTNISVDSSQGTELIENTFFRYKVTILPFKDSQGNETIPPAVGGNIIEVTPLDGYFPTHYRNTGDLSSGLQNSYYNGSKQTEATNLLGGSPVQTFTTNPNILKVSDSGRGSGEPILEVD
jgi:hypothetical protein